MENNSENKWYSIRVVAGKEKKAVENITAELKVNNLEHYVSEILVPTERKVIVSKGKKINRESIVFPGYIMINANMVGELPRTIRRTNLVADLLGNSKGRPTPMKKEEVDRILNNIETSHADNSLVVGDIVNITEGAFGGFNGTITDINESKNKIEVSVMIFGRETKLELNKEQCDRAKK